MKEIVSKRDQTWQWKWKWKYEGYQNLIKHGRPALWDEEGWRVFPWLSHFVLFPFSKKNHPYDIPAKVYSLDSAKIKTRKFRTQDLRWANVWSFNSFHESKSQSRKLSLAYILSSVPRRGAKRQGRKTSHVCTRSTKSVIEVKHYSFCFGTLMSCHLSLIPVVLFVFYLLLHLKLC